MTEKERAISELQSYLRNLSRTDSDIERVISDGKFGEETERAVRSFQAKYGFDENGVVDYDLWTRIKQENQNVIFRFSVPRQIAQISDSDLPLTLGSAGNAIYTLKTMLLWLGQKHSNFDVITVGNIFDEETEKSVKQWQRAIRTDDNGIVDKLTWNLLADYYIMENKNISIPL